MADASHQFDVMRDFQAEDVDRRLAIAIAWPDYEESIQEAVHEILEEAAAETLTPEIMVKIRGSGYHVGPMASGPTIQMLFTAYEDVRPLAQDLATWVTIGAFAHIAINRIRAMLQRAIETRGAQVDADMYPGVHLDSEIVVSQPLIQGLSIRHFVSHYGNAGQIAHLDIASRSQYPEIAWAGRPDRSIIYTIRIWTGQTSYVYLVKGNGEPLEHFRIRGREFLSLPFPEWYEDIYLEFSAQDWG